jgi:hypothetical protein
MTPKRSRAQEKAAFAKKNRPKAGGKRAPLSRIKPEKGWHADFNDGSQAREATGKMSEVMADLQTWRKFCSARKGIDGMVAELLGIEADLERAHQRLVTFAVRIGRAAYAKAGQAPPKLYYVKAFRDGRVVDVPVTIPDREDP